MSERQISMKDQFNVIKPRFVELVDEKTFQKEVSFALQHINGNKQLERATTESKLESVLNVAQCGLSLNPVLKLAYLVPRSEKNGDYWVVKCHLEPSYQGLCKLITDTGSARSISAQIVYDGDEIEISQGSEQYVTHKRKFKSKEVICVYMVAVLSDGSKMVEVMDVEDINEIRERSESYKAFKADKIKSCIWESDWGEMARKTVVRRGVKYLPKTDMWDKLGTAIQLDESDYSATYEQKEYIENLLLTSIIEPEQQKYLYSEIQSMSSDRAREVIEMLKENQIDPIHSGSNYGQTEIKQKINNEIE